MLAYPNINPVALHIGPLSIYWYGLMYLLGFLGGWCLLAARLRVSPRGFTYDQLSDIIFYSAIGVIIGGRLGYMLFYNWQDFINHPLDIFKIWQGGMSFHGGLIGVLLAVWLYGLRIHKSMIEITDFIAPAVPLGLGAGRLGNFINGELWGRVTDVPWGMIFPKAGNVSRHPSQLYEFLLEGVIFFIIMWLYSLKPRPRWAVSGLFLVVYGLMRILVEFFREPDMQIGFVAYGWMTKGQLLSIPMVIIGLAMLFWAYTRGRACVNI